MKKLLADFVTLLVSDKRFAIICAVLIFVVICAAWITKAPFLQYLGVGLLGIFVTLLIVFYPVYREIKRQVREHDGQEQTSHDR